MRTYFNYLRPYFGRMTVGLAIKFGGTIFDLLIPVMLELIIDDVIPTGNAAKIYYYGGIMVLCSVLAVLGNVIANRMASRVASESTRLLRHDLFVKTLYLSCSQTDKFTIPSLESRLTSDTYNVHQFTGMMQRMGVRAPILLIGGLVLAFMLDPVMTLVLVAILPFLGVSVYYIARKSVPMYRRQQSATDDMVRTVRENIQGIRVIKALSKTDYERRRFDGVNKALMKREEIAGLTVSATNPLMNFFLYVGLTVVIVVGAFRVNAGTSAVGKIMAFMTFFNYILNAMLSVTRIFTTYSRCSASMSRITEVLEAQPELGVITVDDTDANADGADGKPAADAPHIEFDDVTFSYNGKRDNLSHVSFSLGHGQTLGVIGATGAGKTTLISLLLRFYDPDGGRIFIDGRDIRTIEPDELYEKFGVALQSDFLFADTIHENVRFGRDIDDEAIDNAIEYAQAREFVENKEGGTGFVLDIKGANLSGGQKQRLLIARALASSPDILILDDSSSALDYKTDANLRGAIANSFESSTKIIVAQRVSSIMSADLILVLDGGVVIAAGTDAELRESCDIYREIAESQMGGAILD